MLMTDHRRILIPVLTAALLLAGCAGPARAPGPAGSGGAAPSSGPLLGGLFGSGLSPALEAQRARLHELLKGTPVVVEATADKQLRVAVPTRFAFDSGKAIIKPALAKVLDHVATGFKPQAASSELRIAVPADDDASPRLIEERGLSARDYLVGRGVPLQRIVALGRAADSGLEIVVSDRPAAR